MMSEPKKEVELISEVLKTRVKYPPNMENQANAAANLPFIMMAANAAPPTGGDFDVDLKWIVDSDGLVYMSMPVGQDEKDPELKKLFNTGISMVNIFQKEALIEKTSFLDTKKFEEILNKFPLLAKFQTETYHYDAQSSETSVSKDLIANILGVVSAPTRIANATTKIFRSAQNDFKVSSEKMAQHSELAKCILMIEYMFGGTFILKIKYIRATQDAKAFAVKCNCFSHTKVEESLDLETDIYLFDKGEEFSNIIEMCQNFESNLKTLKDVLGIQDDADKDK